MTIDDAFSDVAARIPSFGGLFVDEPSHVVYVWSTSGLIDSATAARATLIDLIGSNLDRDIATWPVRVLTARWDFPTLRTWMIKATQQLAASGVVLTDVDDRNNRVEIGVDSDIAETTVRGWMAAEGVPSDAVSIIKLGRIRSESLQAFHRPVVGGLQIWNEHMTYFIAPCTLGVNARRAGVQGFITANHCREYGQLYQPTKPNYPIGTEQIHAQRYTGGQLCPPGEYCMHADVLFAPKLSGVSFLQGRVAYPQFHFTPDWNGVDNYIIKKETSALIGQGLYKVGRTTGRSYGIVSGQCVNVKNTDVFSPDVGVWYTCHSLADYYSEPGDSGGPVVRPEGDLWYHVALKGFHSFRIGETTTRGFSPIGGVPLAIGQIDTCVDFSC